MHSAQTKGLSSKQRKIKRLSLYVFILLIASLSFLMWTTKALLEEPLCNSWKPDLSKKEKIFRALETVNQLTSVRFEISLPSGKKTYRMFRQIPYDTVEMLLKKNPDCCHIYTSATARTNNPSETLSASDEGIVHLHYRAFYKDSSGFVRFGMISEYADYNLCTD